MNYLAHIYLSGDNPAIQIGNFIGDFVKGSSYHNYPPSIRKGIILHRKIDHFTDNHPSFLKITQLLRPTFGRYSGIVTDMYIDHLFATHFSTLTGRKSLRFFSYRFYFSALVYYGYLPGRVRNFIFHFIFTNRLSKYANQQGLHDSLKIMSTYKIPSLNPDTVIDFLNSHQSYIENEFFTLWDDITSHFSNQSHIENQV